MKWNSKGETVNAVFYFILWSLYFEIQGYHCSLSLKSIKITHCSIKLVKLFFAKIHRNHLLLEFIFWIVPKNRKLLRNFVNYKAILFHILPFTNIGYYIRNNVLFTNKYINGILNVPRSVIGDPVFCSLSRELQVKFCNTHIVYFVYLKKRQR